MTGDNFPILLGLQGALYASTNGRTFWGTLSNTTGIWTGSPSNSLYLVSTVRNVTLNVESGDADFSSRLSDIALEGPGLFKISVDLEFPWTPTDSGMQLFVNAFWSRSPLQLATLDSVLGVNSLAQGLWSDWVVKSLPLEQPLDKEQSSKIKIAPTLGASVLAGVRPCWVMV